jgi:hypothetical protein
MNRFKVLCKETFVMVLTVFAVLAFSHENGFAQLTSKASHDHVEVNFFYHGSEFSIRGVADPDVDLIAKITSTKDQNKELMKKGKVGGLLWMNVGQIEFDHAPSVYMIWSTKDLKDILSSQDQQRNVIGYPALKDSIEIRPAANEQERSRWFNEFVKFNEASKLFSITSGGIKTIEGNGEQKYSLDVQWPYQVLPGEYTVTVYAVKDRHIIEKAESKVVVSQVGTVKTLSHMAKNNGALYGVVSIFVAMTSGFGVGIIFKGGGASH